MANAFFSISATFPTQTPPNNLSPFPKPQLSSLSSFSPMSTPISSSDWMRDRARCHISCLCSQTIHPSTKTQKKQKKRNSPPVRPPVFNEGKGTDDGRLACPGCGVFMQDLDPNLPGYYQKRSTKGGELLDFDSEEELDGFSQDEELVSKPNLDDDFLMFDEESVGEGLSDEEKRDAKGQRELGFDWDSDWETEEEEQEEDRINKELDGFGPAGVGYGNITEEIVEKQKKGKISKTEKKRRTREAKREEVDAVTVCARCHSLRSYGQVKNEKAENLIPDFDFDRLVTSSLIKPASTSPVVIMVVDCVDFDGSFPKQAAKSLFKVLDGIKKDDRLSKPPKIILVATKTDLLPSQISPTRLDRWVRNRAKAGGAPKLTAVYLVSARKDLGVRNLLSFIKESSGPRGNVWVIGAQNAGKSTLINAFAKKEGVKLTRLTEAAIPGTTLGIIRIGGILPAKAKMYDTPGLLHSYLMSMRLSREEQKMVEIRKELQPRSYRVKAGQTIHVGGLARLDLTQASVQTIYITVWASANVSLHLGKTVNADEIWNKHVGLRLQPPVGQDRVAELGQWREQEIEVSGVSWEVNNIDIVISGLGWFSLGLKGEATVKLWTYHGVEVTKRDPLVIDRAPFLERPGFLLPKAISEALGNQSKLEAQVKKLEM